MRDSIDRARPQAAKSRQALTGLLGVVTVSALQDSNHQSCPLRLRKREREAARSSSAFFDMPEVYHRSTTVSVKLATLGHGVEQ